MPNTQDLLVHLLSRVRHFHSARAVQLRQLIRTDRGWVLIANVETGGEKADRVIVFKFDGSEPPVLESSFYC